MTNAPALQPPPASWKWIGLIGGLGFLVICLNAALFVLVQQHERGIATREDDVRRRLVEATAKEAQLGAIRIEIASLEEVRTIALRRKEDAEKGAADTERIQSERNRLFADKRMAEAELSKITAEIEGQRRQLEALKSENAAASKTATTKAEENKSLEARRDTLTTDITKLESRKLAADREAEAARKEASDMTRLKVDRDNMYRELQEKSADVARLRPLVEGLKASQSNIAVNEAAAKKADESRTAAEQSLAKKLDELQSIEQRLVQLKADVSRQEQLRTTQAVDQATLQRSAAARMEAETSLAKVRSELAETEKRMAAARSELAGLEQRRQQIAIDEFAARRAQESRAEAEKILASTQVQIADLLQRKDDASAQLDDLRRRLNEENRRFQELRMTSDPPTPSVPTEPAPQTRAPAPGSAAVQRPIPGPPRPRPPTNPAPRATSPQ